MKTSLPQIKNKISQAGSMMIEAMAMLALISLVTPTLYKKSAERTTELQDINTATHARTVLKALDNYVKLNYQNLIAPDGHLLPHDGDVMKIEDITSDEFKTYFPYGYEFDNLKNFEKPKAALRRQGNSVTAFVEFPSSYDLGEMRAARIASIVGSNGGYVNKNKEALGVGGIWSLEEEDLNELGFDATKESSIVVASSEAINSATTQAMENEKYLQRTKVESEDQLWRNTMTTDLYMGNPKGDEMGERYKILGVDQMIVGSINQPDHEEDLVLVKSADNDGGSAWLEGTFHALKDNFRLDTDEEGYSMLFGSENSPTIQALTDEKVSFNNGQVVFDNVDEDSEDNGATFLVNTQIEKNLNVFGDTTVATDTDAVFRAGVDGSYITAGNSSVDLLDGNITTTREGDERNTIIDTDLQVNGNTKMGEGDKKPTRENWNMRLNVQGNAFVSDILEAGEIDTKKFKVLELHAGGEDYDQEHWWLNATRDGVTVTDPQTGLHRFSASTDATQLYSQTGDGDNNSALILDEGDADLRGENEVNLYTTEEEDGQVNIQEDALIVSGHGTEAQVDVNAAKTLVNGGTFNIHDGTEEEVGKSSFYVDPKHVNSPDSGGTGLVQMNANVTRVAPRDKGVFEVVENNSQEDNWDDTGSSKILRVSADSFPEAGQEDRTMRGSAELDLTRFRLWDNEGHDGEEQSILTVQLDNSLTNDADGYNREDSKSSIYIRRGAIEIEPTTATATPGEADKNLGYIEASRFVANNVDPDEPANYIQPKFTKDYDNTEYADNYVAYDRYMVNPAYTSVMHDIKLTTRGGARLSDLLPDFINKGIYVVNNTYKDDGAKSLQTLKVVEQNKQLIIESLQEAKNDDWASPFLGVVPAPQCPPGHARVITIMPATFLMAQAGQLVVHNKHVVVDSLAQWMRLGESGYDQSDVEANVTMTGAQFRQTNVGDQTIYYLGYGSVPEGIKENDIPQPLYFQQSTWLKSAVYPYELNKAGPCNSTIGSDKGCDSGFAGWVTVMGFIYPGSEYQSFIKNVLKEKSVSDEEVYWNLFPIHSNTLEAYATVYCYFDRTSIFGTQFDTDMVDTDYDQLHQVRTTRKKEKNEYIERLDDPTLKYKSPW